MRLLKENLLLQFSVISLVIMLILAVVISTVLTGRLGHSIDLLKDNNAALVAGVELKPENPRSIQSITGEVSSIRWITYGSIAAGFVVLYLGLVGIV